MTAGNEALVKETVLMPDVARTVTGLEALCDSFTEGCNSKGAYPVSESPL